MFHTVSDATGDHGDAGDTQDEEEEEEYFDHELLAATTAEEEDFPAEAEWQKLKQQDTNKGLVES